MAEGKVKKKIISFGHEADENNFKISEYKDDILELLDIAGWMDIPGDLKIDILRWFAIGKEQNQKARE